ncbi:hypothetical protein LMH87_011785 [Akanthomyces muscarius]|uniref:Uncharacterized protein n=1 Tax=Akanthomyces muscarius TaxID=2231603 RepID=A0A9W8UIS5_AKAMU|nr:hypothetical protein LMH87_011785 [Akanthomyces muscarius]KAJ4151068.1 hypothetical protein LMH87_011785 [Akanthomyces muscarius]
MAAIAPPTGSSPISTAAIDPFLYPDSHGILTRNWGEIQQRFILSLFFFEHPSRICNVSHVWLQTLETVPSISGTTQL